MTTEETVQAANHKPGTVDEADRSLNPTEHRGRSVVAMSYRRKSEIAVSLGAYTLVHHPVPRS
jgi:hypothetical protein